LLPTILLIALLLLTWGIAASEASRIEQSHPVWVVTLKGDHSQIRGDVIFSLSRYVLIYAKLQVAKQQYQLIAIPQTEIQKIETLPIPSPQK
jgi:hypothetical protein